MPLLRAGMARVRDDGLTELASTERSKDSMRPSIPCYPPLLERYDHNSKIEAGLPRSSSAF